MIIFTVIGIVVSVLFAIFLLWIMSLAWVNDLDDERHIISFFGFGIAIAKSERTKEIYNNARKTQDRTVFITAPYWFNKHVWNIGGRK